MTRPPLRSPSRRRAGALLVGLGLGAGTAPWAAAQDANRLRILVGFAPGGVGDTVARILAEALKVELNRDVIVENRAGAGGRLAAEALKAAAPDGNTVLQGPDGWAVFPTLLYSASVLKYDVMQDMAPVGRVVSYPLALVVSTSLGVNSVREYAALLRARPATALYGTAAAGGQTQFLGTLLGQTLGTPLTLVPYKGNGPLLTDLVGGHVPAAIMVAGDALKLQSDKLKVLAIFAKERWPLAPQLPTFLEQGYAMNASEAWLAWWAPAKTPQPQLDRLQDALRKVLSLPQVREAIVKTAGVHPDFRPAAQLDAAMRAELAHWGPVIKASGYKPD